MKDVPTDPRRWSTGPAASPFEQRLGAALRVAGAATLRAGTTARPLAVAPSRSARPWAMPVMAAAVALALGAGTVAAAQAVRLARRARDAARLDVNIPAGSTVSIARPAGRQIFARGPLTIDEDADRITIAGAGEARIESGARPVEIDTGWGAAVQVAAGATWSRPPAIPPAPRPSPSTPATEPLPDPPPGASGRPEPFRHGPSARAPATERLASALGPPSPGAPAPLIDPPLPRRGGPAPEVTAVGGDGAEAVLVAAVFRALRADHDPAAALSLLDRHASLFPSGTLLVEAGMARVEALLALGRTREALAALEQLSGAAGAMSPARLLLRGELRAAAGRCAGARADFAVVEKAGPGELSARAHAAAAACAARADGTSSRDPTVEPVGGAPP